MTRDELAGRELDAVLGTSDVRLFTFPKRTEAINAAQDEFVRLTKCYVRDHVVDLLTYDPLAGIDLSAIEDFIDVSPKNLPFIVSVEGGVLTTVASGDTFPRRSPDWLDRFMPGWRNSDNTGTPQVWMVKQDGPQTIFRLAPNPAISPAGAVWTLTIPYFAVPDAMDSNDEPFSTNGVAAAPLRIYHPALAYYAGYLLEPLRRNEAGAAVHLSKFMRVVEGYNREPQTFGPQHVTFARNYLSEVNRRPAFNDEMGDPRR